MFQNMSQPLKKVFNIKYHMDHTKQFADISRYSNGH